MHNGSRTAISDRDFALAILLCVDLPSLQTLRFPNREHDLRTVLPMAACNILVQIETLEYSAQRTQRLTWQIFVNAYLSLATGWTGFDGILVRDGWGNIDPGGSSIFADSLTRGHKTHGHRCCSFCTPVVTEGALPRKNLYYWQGDRLHARYLSGLWVLWLRGWGVCLRWTNVVLLLLYNRSRSNWDLVDAALSTTDDERN